MSYIIQRQNRFYVVAHAVDPLTGKHLLGERADEVPIVGGSHPGKDSMRLRADPRDEVVGRNILEGRWTFQVMEEFGDEYYEAVRPAVRSLEADIMDDRRHVYEDEMKERRRTRGRRHHQSRPTDSAQ